MSPERHSLLMEGGPPGDEVAAAVSDCHQRIGNALNPLITIDLIHGQIPYENKSHLGRKDDPAGSDEAQHDQASKQLRSPI